MTNQVEDWGTLYDKHKVSVPTIRDFEICLWGEWWNPEKKTYEHIGWSAGERERYTEFDFVEDQVDGSDYPDAVERLIVIKHRETDEHWGVRCIHDSWSDSGMVHGNSPSAIKRVEKRPVSKEEWVFV